MKNLIAYTLLFSLASSTLFGQSLPSGIVAKYLLNGNVTDISGNNYNGTLTGVTNTTNRFGTSNSALQFTSGTSSGTLPVMIKDNYSIAYWFKTTMTANTGSQWYSGNSLIDAEVCGVVNDWGTDLINGGHVAFGTGNPDVTIISPLSYNDGNWHFVTITRNETSPGTMTLYLDGIQVATQSGSVNTGTENSPTIIGLARNNCTGANYTGDLDDLLFFGRVLSSAEVSNLYNTESAIVLPISWISFEALPVGNKFMLDWQVAYSDQVDHFEVDRSTDGEHFASIGNQPAKNSVTSGAISYSFEDGNPNTGVNYYRIAVSNIDGTTAYSNIIKGSFQNSATGLSILSNPVLGNRLELINAGSQLINEIDIIDLTGRILMQTHVNSQNTSIQIDLHNLSQGLYFVEVINTAKKIALPFVKQ
jgi:Concanavalin A-like lectin/glucanases superfamily/Secretion system C-terminal sorting domain